MTPEEKTALDTERAWEILDSISYKDQGELLDLVGVIPQRFAGNRQRQLMNVIFHGSVPNYVEEDRLTDLKNNQHTS